MCYIYICVSVCIYIYIYICFFMLHFFLFVVGRLPNPNGPVATECASRSCATKGLPFSFLSFCFTLKGWGPTGDMESCSSSVVDGDGGGLGSWGQWLASLASSAWGGRWCCG